MSLVEYGVLISKSTQLKGKRKKKTERKKGNQQPFCICISAELIFFRKK